MTPNGKMIGAGVVALAGVATLVWSGMRTLGVGGMAREIHSAASGDQSEPPGGMPPNASMDAAGDGPRFQLGKGDGTGPAWTPADGESVPEGAFASTGGEMRVGGELTGNEPAGGPRIRMGGPGGSTHSADPTREYEFTSVDKGTSGDLALDGLERAWRDGLDAQASMKDLGMARREQLAKEARGLIEPLIAKDFAAWDAQVRALGATIPEDPAPVREQFDRLTVLLGSASLALKDAGVQAVDPDAPRALTDSLPNDGFNANAMVQVRRNQDPGGQRTETRLTSLHMAAGGMFPGVASYKDDRLRAAVVRVPARIKGSKSAKADGIFSVTMAWNAEAGHWQPACWDLEIFNNELMAGMNLRRGG